MINKLIVANWKMNGSMGMLADYARAVADLPVVICPPAPLLAPLGELLRGTQCMLGAQDCHAEPAGAFTGDVSAALLHELGVRCVIVGHSERRRGHGESDAFIWRKAALAAEVGMTPILCVGEKMGEDPETAIEQQLHGLGSFPGREIIVAYEPVWAISAAGTGQMPQPDRVNSIHMSIEVLLNKICPNVSSRIIYGGSVNAENAGRYLVHPAIKGALVGAASLDPQQMRGIYGAGAAG